MNLVKYKYYLASIWKLWTGIEPRSQLIRLFLGLSGNQPQVFHLSGQDVCFKTRSAMDLWTVKETYLDRFYEKFGTPIGDGWTLVDIGGGIGDFSILAAKRHPTNTVYVFEPTLESYNLLLENLRINDVANVKAYPYAIWGDSRNLVINTFPGEAVQYTSRPVGYDTGLDQGLVVESLSLEEAFEHTGLAHCNLLKIDCEGAEYSIILNTPDAVLNRIDRIIMEYHEFEEQHVYGELVDFLIRKGFSVKTIPNYVHAYLGYLYAYR
jgi:FkbM family methyltransferase